MRSKIKIRLKNGKIAYCYEMTEIVGYETKNGYKRPIIKRTHYKEQEGDELFEEKDFEIIPWEPYELFGIECNKGWHKLIEPILKYIEEYNKDKKEEEQIVIEQIKEKFSDLRITLSFYTPELKKLIEKAQDEASKTCELCGNTENVGLACEGWLTVECHDCMKNWCEKHERPHRWKSFKDGKIYWVNPKGEDELFEGCLP